MGRGWLLLLTVHLLDHFFEESFELLFLASGPAEFLNDRQQLLLNLLNIGDALRSELSNQPVQLPLVLVVFGIFLDGRELDGWLDQVDHLRLRLRDQRLHDRLGLNLVLLGDSLHIVEVAYDRGVQDAQLSIIIEDTVNLK